MIDPVRQALVEAYIDAYNRFDIDGMLATLSADVRFEHYGGGELAVATNGKAEFEKLARVGAAMFASRTQRVTAMEVRGETLVVGIDFHGEVAEDIPEGPSAGTVIDMTGTSEFEFADGKICRVIDKA